MEASIEKTKSLQLLAGRIGRFLESKGHRPACPTIDAEKIIFENVQDLTFYVNQHNLAWYADKAFRTAWVDSFTADNTIDTNLRELALSEIGI